MSLFRVLSLMILILQMGCGGDAKVSILPSSDLFAQVDEFNPKMDILWVVDNSNSMKQDIDNVITNINEFLKVYKDQKYDFRMGVISSSAWALESYEEFKACIEALEPEESSSVCLRPNDAPSPTYETLLRDYLIHPETGKVVFGTLHRGECIAQDSGYSFIDNSTPHLESVFALNFNVYGVDDGGTSYEGNCGTNRNYTPANTQNPNTAPYYIPYIHDFYYGTKNLSGPSPHYGSAERSRLFAYVGDERPIQSMRAFLEYSPDVDSFIRPEAFLAVILITDEPDSSRESLVAFNSSNTTSGFDVQEYIDFLRDKKGSEELFRVYSITRTGQTSAGYKKMYDIADLSGGFVLKIRESNDSTVDPNDPEGRTFGAIRYLEMLTQITSNVVEAATQFQLNCVPNLNTDVMIRLYEPPYRSFINVPKASNDPDGQGWEYIGDVHAGGTPGVLVFTEDYFPQSGTKIYIDYTPIQLGCNTKTGEN